MHTIYRGIINFLFFFYQAVKEITGYEKRMKQIEEEIASIKSFVQHNTTNFIMALRPAMKAHFPHRYGGQAGAQRMHKEMRLIKIACGGKIPNDVTKENITSLIEKGRSKVNVATGTPCMLDDNPELRTYRTINRQGPQ